MKKIIIIITVLALSFFTVKLLSAHETITHDVKQLPQTAQDFIKKHFAKEKVSYIKIDKEILETEYEVRFENGTSIDFAGNGNWKDVDCENTAVPTAIIPKKIQSYVNQNFKGQTITKIDNTERHYDIELSNGLDLEFDTKGNFLRMDD